MGPPPRTALANRTLLLVGSGMGLGVEHLCGERVKR